MTEWYVSRHSIRIDRSVYRIAGTDPLNELALAPGLLGEHARWMLRLKQRYQRWPWWQISPPRPITTIVWLDDDDLTISVFDRIVALLITAYAVWKAL